MKKKNSIFSYYKKFIQLRKNHDSLSTGDITLLDVHDDNIICYLRTSSDEALLIILNFTKHKRKIKLSDIGLPLQTDNLIFTTNLEKNNNENKYVITLKAFEGAIYSLDL
jgi:glycosidase